jgi:hypothetical protein
MPVLSVFLSHSSEDKPLVEEVAACLGRRGIVAWLDKDDLVGGDGLKLSLEQGIEQTTALVLFLSAAAAESGWVTGEVQTAMLKLDRRVLPVLMCPVAGLGERFPWLTKVGLLDAKGGLLCVGHDATRAGGADEIAAWITHALIERIEARGRFGIVIDQRGRHRRVGFPNQQMWPAELIKPEAPVLVFRPDRGPRGDDELCCPELWERWRPAMAESLQRVLHRMDAPEKVVVVSLRCQLGLAWQLGRWLQRKHRVRMTVRNAQNGERLSNESWRLQTPISGGSEAAMRLPPDLPRRVDRVVLAVVAPDYEAAAFRFSLQQGSHLVLLPFGYLGVDSSRELAANLRACLVELRVRFSVTEALLVTSAPVHVMPLLASALMERDVEGVRLRFFEAVDGGQYIELSLE